MKKKFTFVLLILLFALAACVPSQQQVVEILSAVEQTATAQVTLVAPIADVDAIVQATFQSLTAQAALTSQPAGNTGGISGNLSYPSEGIPPQLVVAFNVDTGFYYWVLTEQNQATYQIDNLPVGAYNVISYLMPDGSLVGTYDQFYLCGLQQGCNDYTMVDVIVKAGQVTPNINPGNWYGDAKNYPEIPSIAGGQQAPVFINPIPQVSSGGIAGQLSYPSSFIPAQTVVAFSTDSQAYYYVMTADGQGSYQIDNLPPGNYNVVSYLGDGSMSAGYSQAVPCGLSVECSDHSLVSVSVTGGQIASGINPQDWYAPEGSFPAYPLP